MSNIQIIKTNFADEDGEFSAWVSFGDTSLQSFLGDTPDDAMAKAREWARDLRDALNAADLDAPNTVDQNTEAYYESLARSKTIPPTYRMVDALLRLLEKERTHNFSLRMQSQADAGIARGQEREDSPEVAP